MTNPTRVLLHVPVPWVFILGYLVGAAVERVHRTNLTSNAAYWSPIAGGALFLAGAALAGWAWTIFRRARTTTVPGKSSATLVTWGPYRFTRNPMYVGLTLAYLGEAGLLKQFWPVAILLLVVAYVNWTVIPVEEAKLEEVFPGEYRQYRSRVRRWV